MDTQHKPWYGCHSLVLYFLLTYAICWAFMIPVALITRGWVSGKVPGGVYYLASFGLLSAALIVTGITEGRQGIRVLLSRLLKCRVEDKYYLFAILGQIGLLGLAVMINRIITAAWPDVRLLREADYLPYLTPLGTLGLWLLAHGMGEETGWRRFALPRLQQRPPARAATLILAIIWARWYLPAMIFRDRYLEMGYLAFPLTAFTIFFFAMVFTWLYNSSGSSLLLVVLFHSFFKLAVSFRSGWIILGSSDERPSHIMGTLRPAPLWA